MGTYDLETFSLSGGETGKTEEEEEEEEGTGFTELTYDGQFLTCIGKEPDQNLTEEVFS